MAEEADQEHGDAATGSASPIAAQIAMNASAGAAAEAGEYLRKQSRVADLQIENLRKLDEFEVSHLRWRRFNDQMRGALQILTLVAGLAMAAGIVAVLWGAHEAKGLVIQPLRTPPDFALRGLDGTTLSQRLLDKLNALVTASNGFTFRSADSIEGSWGDESKVEIPDTGISISELERSLRLWLGNETHVSGEVWRTEKGIAVAVRAGSNPGNTLAGSDKDLDKLLDAAAEQLLRQTQPYTYAGLQFLRGNIRDSSRIMQQIADHGSKGERPWGYIMLAGILPNDGRTREGVMAGDKAVELSPENPFGWANRGAAHYLLGEFEDTLADDRRAHNLFMHADEGDLSPAASEGADAGTEVLIGETSGDFALAAKGATELRDSGFVIFSSAADLPLAAFAARGHDLKLSVSTTQKHPTWNDVFALKNGLVQGFYPTSFFQLIEKGEWRRAASDLANADQAVASESTLTDFRNAFVRPWLAFAFAKSGDFGSANKLIASCPLNSYPCLEMRGRILAVEGSWAGAAYWFARSNNVEPSIPFANSDWGEMLLHKGDYDAAIAKFMLANQKGPHFADPLEMWGEALMLKNRSDLALAKFEDANKYAPNWGRLHMKWGEALGYVGRKDEARAQYRIASTLDLSVADKAELARDMRT